MNRKRREYIRALLNPEPEMVLATDLPSEFPVEFANIVGKYRAVEVGGGRVGYRFKGRNGSEVVAGVEVGVWKKMAEEARRPKERT